VRLIDGVARAPASTDDFARRLQAEERAERQDQANYEQALRMAQDSAPPANSRANHPKRETEREPARMPYVPTSLAAALLDKKSGGGGGGGDSEQREALSPIEARMVAQCGKLLSLGLVDDAWANFQSLRNSVGVGGYHHMIDVCVKSNNLEQLQRYFEDMLQRAKAQLEQEEKELAAPATASPKKTLLRSLFAKAKASAPASAATAAPASAATAATASAASSSAADSADAPSGSASAVPIRLTAFSFTRFLTPYSQSGDLQTVLHYIEVMQSPPFSLPIDAWSWTLVLAAAGNSGDLQAMKKLYAEMTGQAEATGLFPPTDAYNAMLTAIARQAVKKADGSMEVDLEWMLQLFEDMKQYGLSRPAPSKWLRTLSPQRRLGMCDVRSCDVM
jgi:hypothetical protein